MLCEILCELCLSVFNVNVREIGVFLLPSTTFQLGLSGSRHVLCLNFPLGSPSSMAPTHTRYQEHYFFSVPLDIKVEMVSHSCHFRLGPPNSMFP